MIEGIEHTALSVSDLDGSIGFYCDLIGLKLIRIIECGPDMKLGDVVGIPDCTARIAHLSSGGQMLELFEYKYPRGKPLTKNGGQTGFGFTHIGFKSSDIHKDYARLSEGGIRFFNKPVEFRPGAWVVYFFGPDNEVCELRQTV
jgi:glyoxylase I family protein